MTHYPFYAHNLSLVGVCVKRIGTGSTFSARLSTQFRNPRGRGFVRFSFMILGHMRVGKLVRTGTPLGSPGKPRTSKISETTTRDTGSNRGSLAWYERGRESSWASASRTTGANDASHRGLSRSSRRGPAPHTPDARNQSATDDRNADTIPDRFLSDPSRAHQPGGVDTRRLRAYLWRQWNNGLRRFRELCHRGVPKFRVTGAAGSPTAYRRMAGHAVVQQVLHNHVFDSLGLPRFYLSGDP